jgi:hypothetical protein
MKIVPLFCQQVRQHKVQESTIRLRLIPLFDRITDRIKKAKPALVAGFNQIKADRTVPPGQFNVSLDFYVPGLITTNQQLIFESN